MKPRGIARTIGSLAAGTWIASLVGVGHAQAAPTARFTARPIQGMTCVAPCTVHFDAIGEGMLSTPTPYESKETTDPAYPKPFHQLLFAWDFGDNTASSCGGTNATWPVSGQPKHKGVGGLAAHTYCAPGTYTVTLTVTNPDGQRDAVAHDVVVADPDVVFAGKTFCVGATTLPEPGVGGCPSGATAINATASYRTADLDRALFLGCDVDAAKVRCLFKAGDTFNSKIESKYKQSAEPGIVGRFGAGPDPVFALGGNRIAFQDGWTFDGIDVTSSYGGVAPFFIDDGRSHITLKDVDLTYTGPGQCFAVGFNPTPPRTPHMVAWVNFSCTANGANADAMLWPHVHYFVFQGGTIDRNGLTKAGGGNGYTLRSTRQQHWVLQYTRWLHATAGGNHWQFRGGDAGPGAPSDAQASNRFIYVSDNETVDTRTNGANRICIDAGCRCEGGNCTTWISTSNYVFERNLFTRDTTGTTGNPNYFFEVSGGDVTFRNNVWDVQGGVASGGLGLVMITGRNAGGKGPAHPPEGGIDVYDNTIYFDDTVSTAITLVTGSAGFGFSGCSGSPCNVRNNLVVTENDASDLTISTGTGKFVASNNLRTREDVFASPPPEQGRTSLRSFAPDANSASVVDAGFPVKTVRLDALALCRPAGKGWDIGALESGAGDACLRPAKPSRSASSD